MLKTLHPLQGFCFSLKEVNQFQSLANTLSSKHKIIKKEAVLLEQPP